MKKKVTIILKKFLKKLTNQLEKQFSMQFQKGVTVYLQYKTTISTKGYEGKRY